MSLKAFVIVDLQNDFLPGGKLAVKRGNEVIPVINELLNKDWDVIVASKDWHPEDHGSFAKNHSKKPGDVVQLGGLAQILWPDHCVQNTRGAQFAEGWDTSKVEQIFYKGVDRDIDSYSTFFDNGHRRTTGLNEYLKIKGVKDVYMAGLATDYCVKYSVLDAVKLGFNVYVITDGCRSVELKPGDGKRALDEMRNAGATIVTSDQCPVLST